MLLKSKRTFRIAICFILIFINNACITNKKIVYFNDPSYNTQNLTLVDNKQDIYKLQPRDVLMVKVNTLDKESAEYFNITGGGNTFQRDLVSMYLDGYSIDQNGNITLPEVGKIQVGGLTVEEAQQKLQQAFSVYLTNASVLVKLVSFKITLLGEVQRPGQYYIYNDQATLLEGLGLAGDMTEFGNRENVTLIRQTNDGVGTILINLKDPKVLSSKYYFLQPNDVVYVQPLEAKNTRRNIASLGVIFGGISTVLFLLNFIRR
jgi:polysaccharide biosynthesis/export protein